MYKKMRRTFPVVTWILLYFCFQVPLQGNEIESLDREKKYQLSICALFKNEARFLKEWIEYHRLIGVDHFYLYNNESRDLYFKVLNPYILEGIVTLIPWPDLLKQPPDGERNKEKLALWALSTQTIAYEHAIKAQCINETKWLVFMNVDEYLVPVDERALPDILESYDHHPGVILVSDHYDASRLDSLPRRKLLIEAIELVDAPMPIIQKEISKTIFKPEECIGFTWPPYQCRFKNDRAAIRLNKSELRINHYLDRYVGPFHAKVREKLQIDHRQLSDEETAFLLREGYEIEDQERLIHRYVPSLLKKMGESR